MPFVRSTRVGGWGSSSGAPDFDTHKWLAPHVLWAGRSHSKSQAATRPGRHGTKEVSKPKEEILMAFVGKAAGMVSCGRKHHTWMTPVRDISYLAILGSWVGPHTPLQSPKGAEA